MDRTNVQDLVYTLKTWYDRCRLPQGLRPHSVRRVGRH